MKNLLMKLGFVLVLVACTNNDQYDIYIVDDGKHGDIISSVKSKSPESRNYSDFLQLAISYSEEGEDHSVVKFWLEKSFKDNKDKSCEVLRFMKENRPSWKLVSEYSDLLNSILSEQDCNPR